MIRERERDRERERERERESLTTVQVRFFQVKCKYFKLETKLCNEN